MKNLFLYGIVIISAAALLSIINKHFNSKLFKNSFRRAIVTVIFLLLSMFPILKDFISRDYSYAYYEKDLFNIQIVDFNNAVNVGQLIDGRVIEQTFYCDATAISSISLYTQTYDRDNQGILTVQLIDLENDKIIEQWNVQLEDVPNNDYLTFDIDDPFRYTLNGCECELKIFSNGATTEDCITLISVPNQYMGGEIIVDGELSDDDLVCEIKGYSDVSNLENVRIWICLLLLLAVEYLINKKSRNGDYES